MYLSVNECAVYLGLSRRSVYRLMEQNVIPYSYAGRRRRVKKADLEAYMKRTKVASNEEVLKMADLKLLQMTARNRWGIF